MLQETWLSEEVEDLQISGYATVSRRDRSKEENRGGIITLRRKDFNNLVHVSHSVNEER